jgi:hypothetical protein
MASGDKPIQARVPRFVHNDLKRLLKDLGGEGNKTRLVAALIHAADLDSAREALRKYSDYEAGRRSTSLR